MPIINGKVYDDNDVTVTADGMEVDFREMNYSDVKAPWTHVHRVGSADPAGATQGKKTPKMDITVSEGQCKEWELRAAGTGQLYFGVIAVQFAAKSVENGQIKHSFSPLNADVLREVILKGPDKSVRQGGGEITPKYDGICGKIIPAAV